MTTLRVDYMLLCDDCTECFEHGRTGKHASVDAFQESFSTLELEDEQHESLEADRLRRLNPGYHSCPSCGDPTIGGHVWRGIA